jgi:NADH-quinone oxidoreductase subunit N
MYGVFYTTSLRYNYPLVTRSTAWLTALILLITFLLVWNSPVPQSILLNHTFIHDTLTNNVKLIILFFSFLCVLSSTNYLRDQKLNSFEYFILILFSVFGLILLVSSYDLISVYLAIELQSLSLYVLASFKKDSAFSTEAGLKYFILGALSSGLILFGSSLIYGFCGTTNFEDLGLMMIGLNNIDQGVSLGLCFIGVGFLFKLAAAPFHMWSPDVYEGAPTTVSTFFAVVPKIGIFTIFLRLFHFSFYEFINYWQQLIILCALISVVIGSFVAIRQRKVKRLLAYSAISHVGYLLIAFSSGTIEGVQALFFYLIIYMITSLVIWNIVSSIEIVGAPRSRYNTDFSSMVNTNPVLAITTALILFSMAGIPPLAGFSAKLFVFFSAMESSLYFLAIFSILTSVISAFYYIRLVKIMFFEKNEKWVFYKPINQETSLILGFGIMFIIFLFFNPTFLYIITQQMALTLFF